MEARGDGALTVQLFPDMQLGGAQENVDQVRSGAVQMTWIGIALLSRRPARAGAAGARRKPAAGPAG